MKISHREFFKIGGAGLVGAALPGLAGSGAGWDPVAPVADRQAINQAAGLLLEGREQ